jgi:hypothetical protein
MSVWIPDFQFISFKSRLNHATNMVIFTRAARRLFFYHNAKAILKRIANLYS